MKPLKALIIIAGTTMALSGSTAIWVGYHYLQQKFRSQSELYEIKIVVQRTSGKYQLETSQIIELLNLSVDHSKNIYTFSVNEATERLLNNAIFKDVKISKIPPETLLVEYSLREPLAYIYGAANTAVDKEGKFMPFFPYYTPKKIPQVHLDIPVKWNASLNESDRNIFMNTVTMLTEYFYYTDETLEMIDLSHALNLEDPLQEIVVAAMTKNRRHLLRLTKASLQGQLELYKKLGPALKKWENEHPSQETVIDLRIPGVAYTS